MTDINVRCYCGHTKGVHHIDNKNSDRCVKCNCGQFRMDLSVTAAEVSKWEQPSDPNTWKEPSSFDKDFEKTFEEDYLRATIADSGLKDSGQRKQFASGMVRDTAEDKPRFDLVIPENIPYEELMLTRWAELLRKGAIKYSVRNWEKADGKEELDHAKASAFRHFMQWFTGETDEDHAAAVFFNINEVETIRYKQTNQKKEGSKW